MKGPKIIALVLILSVIIIGVGYAAWTDTVTISNTVSTGELKVIFLDAIQYREKGAYDNINNEKYIDIDKNYDDVTKENIKKINFKVENMYPGCTYYFDALAKNVGTIPVVIENVKVMFSDDSSETIKNNLLVYGVINQKGNPNGIIIPSPGVLLKNLETTLNGLLIGMELKKSDYIIFDKFKFHLSLTVGNELENQNVEFDIKLNFKQFNE